MVFQKVFFMNMYLLKKGYSKKFHHCIKACFKIFILSDIFCYKQYFNYSIFCGAKNIPLKKEKTILVGAIFVTNSFVNYISN